MMKYCTLLVLSAFVCISLACIGLEDPICGTDGRTYTNECTFDRARKFNPSLQIKTKGKCGRTLRSLPCTEEVNEFCGTDGVTYKNLCYYNEAAKTGNIEMKHRGPCDTDSTKNASEELKQTNAAVRSPRAAKPGCPCTREKNEMCGTDGATYPNPCTLRCATKYNGVKLLHQGPCKK